MDGWVDGTDKMDRAPPEGQGGANPPQDISPKSTFQET